ncbi:MAG TPA: hypothetical protein VJ570_02720, partial [Holophagaceae bacterium]|nr:hypothetical protein [Holophagaceae bacterium]
MPRPLPPRSRRLRSALALCASLLLTAVGSGCRRDTSPKGRANEIASILEKARDRAAATLKSEDLPAPPRAVDMLTGGDFGAAMDLSQALKSGFEPSCQIIYKNALGSLKGMVRHYSRCLGEPMPAEAAAIPGPLITPPSLESEARAIVGAQNPSRRKALQEARRTFIEALLRIRALGPFGTDRAFSPAAGFGPSSRNSESSSPSLDAHESALEGGGKVWAYQLQVPPSRKLYAPAPDGSLWVGTGASGGTPGRYIHIQDGRVLGQFDVPEGLQDMEATADPRGPVVFGWVLDPVQHKPIAYLIQYEGTGKQIWRKDFEWASRSMDWLLQALDSGDVYFATWDLGVPGARIILHVDSAGTSSTIPVPSKMEVEFGTSREATVGGLYLKGQVAYALVGKELYRIGRDRLEEPMVAGYAFMGGRWIQVGDDGNFYLFGQGKDLFRIRKGGAPELA